MTATIYNFDDWKKALEQKRVRKAEQQERAEAHLDMFIALYNYIVNDLRTATYQEFKHD